MAFIASSDETRIDKYFWAMELLQSTDIRSVEEMDPSLADGFRIIYDREVPVEVRMQSPASLAAERRHHQQQHQQFGTLEFLRVKILLLGIEESPQTIRMELSSESDLWFSSTHSVDDESFLVIQQEQIVMVGFVEYANVLVKMFNEVINESERYMTVFVMQEDKRATLDFIQNLGYKHVDLLTCPLVRAADEAIRQQISYRYNAMKSQMVLMRARLHDIAHALRHKNPNMLMQLQKTPVGSSLPAAGRSTKEQPPSRTSSSSSSSSSGSTSSNSSPRSASSQRAIASPH